MTPFEIHVADLLRSSAAPRSVEVAATVDWELDLSRVAPDPAGGPNLHLDLTLTPVGGGLLVAGTSFFVARHTCHRCLDEWTEPMEVPISALFSTQHDTDDVVFPLADIIDLEPAVRDDVLVAMPVAPTCPAGCAAQLVGDAENGLNTPAAAGDDPAEDVPEDPDREGSPFAVLRDLLDRGD